MGRSGSGGWLRNEDIFLSEVWNGGEKAIKGSAPLTIFVRASPITCYIIIPLFTSIDSIHGLDLVVRSSGTAPLGALVGF
jgi:hypothetical protein